MATRHRPRRGPNPIVSGDTGTYGGNQGGARTGRDRFRESGDLDSREYGVPQADLPGGKMHVVNPETHADKPPGVPERPADYHKYHGVASDDGPYETPDGTVGQTGRPVPVPKVNEAVPVYIVERADDSRAVRGFVTEGPQAIATQTIPADPIRVADRDPARVKVYICNETTPSAAGAVTPLVRIGDFETVSDGRGIAIPAGTMKDFETQDALYLTNQSGTTVTVSWGFITEYDAAGA